MLCIASTAAAAFIINSYARVFWAVAFAVLITFWAAYDGTVHAFMTYDAFIAILHARGFIGDAFSQFMPAFIDS